MTKKKPASELTTLRRRISELEALSEYLSAVHQSSQRLQYLYSPEVLAQEIIGILESSLDYEYGAVLLIDETTKRLTPFALSDQGHGVVFVEEDKTYVASHDLQIGVGITGSVAQTGQSIRVGDARLDPRYYAMRSNIRSELCVPLRTKDKVIGVVNIETPKLNAYTEIDQRVLETIASQIAVAIQNAQLFEGIKDVNFQLARQIDFLEVIRTIDKTITASADLNISVELMLAKVCQILKVDAADILLFDLTTLTLECTGRRGFLTNALQHTHLRLGQGLAGQAALDRKIVSVQDFPGDNDWFLKSPDLSEENFVFYYGVPLIAKGALKGVLEIFHRSPLSPDDEWLLFLDTLARQAAVAIDNATLFTSLQQSNIEIRLAYDITLEGWARALELRDMETEGHSRRVSTMAVKLAKRMGLSDDELVHVRRGALLHDIGKMGVPDTILLKPDKLTDEEWIIMRRHPEFAYEMLQPIEFLRSSLDIPYCHHEKWDGTGYPRKLKGDEIPLVARIFAVIDVQDAIAHDRPYRKAWTEEKAVDHIRAQAGIHFDPIVVQSFLQMLGEEKKMFD